MRQLPSANQLGELSKHKNGVIAAAAVMLMLCPAAGQASDSVFERSRESEIAAVVASPLPGNLYDSNCRYSALRIDVIAEKRLSLGRRFVGVFR